MARWALLATRAPPPPPHTHPAARAAGGRWVPTGQRASRWPDGEVRFSPSAAEVAAPPSPTPSLPSLPGPQGFPWEWLLQDHGVRLCDRNVAQTPSDTQTEGCVPTTSAAVSCLPVLFPLSPGFLTSEHFIMCLIVYVVSSASVLPRP